MILRLFYILLFSIVLGISEPAWSFFPLSYSASGWSSSWLMQQARMIHTQVNNLSSNVLYLALLAYMNVYKQGISHKPVLTVIDYSRPANEKRLWVLDLKHGKPLLNTWVSHGKNSGGLLAHYFSNRPGSLQSSFGVFVTSLPYVGSHGYSLRIKGLEHGINDNAYRRNIVFHGSQYVRVEAIKKYGHIGRSWGCPAVSPDTVGSLINAIKEQTVVFAYYPNRYWLTHSKFFALK